MRMHPVWRALLGGAVGLLLTACLGNAQPPEPKQPASPPLPEGLRHVPPDAMGFVHFRAGDFLKSAIGKTLLQELRKDPEAAKGFKKIEQTLGIEAADLESVTLLVLTPPSRLQMNPWDGSPRGPRYKQRFGPDFEMKRKADLEKADKEAFMRRIAEQEAGQRRADEDARRQRAEELRRKLEAEKKKSDEKNSAKQESPVIFQDGRFDQPFPDIDPLEVADYLAYSGPLMIVTSTKTLDRKKILRAQFFQVQRRDFYDSHRSQESSALFLGDRTVMIGVPWELARYSELMARNPGPTAKPMQSALALGASPHFVVAGGHLPAEVRRMYLFYYGPEKQALAAVSPLMLTEAALALDLGTTVDLTLQFQAQTEASAGYALQAVKSLRVLAELALEKSREDGESGGWKLELENGLAKGLANAAIEQKEMTVHARVKLELGPAFYKKFTKDIVAAFRSSGDRRQHVNNLKQIGLAMHSYNDAFKRLPPAAISGINDPTGKPLLSWRVAILPYIEQDALYREFNLDQPWDHPTNKKLIGRMPQIYMMPGVDAKEGETHYRVLVGPDTMLEPIKGPGGRLTTRFHLGNIPDGTSNTIMVVEAKDPTIWTRPDDLPYDPKGPLPKFGVWPDGFHVLMGDASVRFVRSTISERTLRHAITCSDGNPLGPDWEN
jgi:hypothetical protein